MDDGTDAIEQWLRGPQLREVVVVAAEASSSEGRLVLTSAEIWGDRIRLHVDLMLPPEDMGFYTGWMVDDSLGTRYENAGGGGGGEFGGRSHFAAVFRPPPPPGATWLRIRHDTYGLDVEVPLTPQ